MGVRGTGASQAVSVVAEAEEEKEEDNNEEPSSAHAFVTHDGFDV